MARGTARVRRRALAAHLVEAPPLPVAIVAEHFHKTAGVEVCAPWTVIVDQTIVSKLRAIENLFDAVPTIEKLTVEDIKEAFKSIQGEEQQTVFKILPVNERQK